MTRLTAWPSRARITRRHSPRRPRHDAATLRLELLEDRTLLSAGLGALAAPLPVFTPTYVINHHAGVAGAFATSGPTGYNPSQIRHAYGVDGITFSGNTPGDGSGTTIAIVDAFDDPNIANDLHQFDLQFNLSDPVFTKVNQRGGSTMPAADSGWASEIALDVEWAHAIAPGANILLVEADDNSYGNLLTAVDFAARQSGVVVVSMSWGSGEFNGETLYDSHFTTPNGHGGVSFVASSGDAGPPPSYPAVSPNVLAVGGTTLQLDPQGNRLSESGWSGSGGGISAFESQPAYQKGVVTQSNSMRTNPDVAWDADPNTGFAVYDSFNGGSSTPWFQFGGTSAGAPQWSGVLAIANQGRGIAGLGSLDGAGQALSMIYSAPSSAFFDIITGSNGYPAIPGYDLVTGRGTPIGNTLVAALVGVSAHFTVTAPSSTTAGAPFDVTVSALDQNNNVITNYSGTVHWTSSDSSAFLPPDYTFNVGDAGVHTFTGLVLKKAGNQTITVKDTANSAMGGTATVTVNAASATQLVFGQQPTNAAVNAIITPAVTVKILDAFGNVVTGDNTDQVTLAIGNNPGGGTLSGINPVTVSSGVATFSNLSINKPGVGYTLTASSGALTATSNGFNISSSRGVEDFEHGGSYFVVGSSFASAAITNQAAHDGALGLQDFSGQDWIYNNDSFHQAQQGDAISAWIQFAGAADGRAYFGFGASSTGTLSLVLAPNSNQLIIQKNLGYGFTNIAAVSQTYKANHWYRIEVDWSVGGGIVGRLFDSNGTTLLKTVKATTNVITSGGIAFRAFGHDKYWDTVTASPVSSVVSGATSKHADDSNSGAPAGGVNSDFLSGSLGSAPSQSRGTLLVIPGLAALVQSPSVRAPQISLAAAEPLIGRAQAAANIGNDTLPSISRTTILLSGSGDHESPNATDRTDEAAPILEMVPMPVPEPAAAPQPVGIKAIQDAALPDRTLDSCYADQECLMVLKTTRWGGAESPVAPGACAALVLALGGFWARPPQARDERRAVSWE